MEYKNNFEFLKEINDLLGVTIYVAFSNTYAHY